MKEKYLWNGKFSPNRIIAMLLAIVLCLPWAFTVSAEPSGSGEALSFDCKSAILMEASTGKILFEQNADEALPPASVTKVMTLLLVMEAIEEGRLTLDDKITASAHASSMGGSQIFLKEGEEMSAEDMIKSVVIASANDAAVALAEHIAGSEEAFVARMNERAAELGMTNTHFENTNGLDDTVERHLTSARDIALMSQALIRYEKITEYASIWQDTIRGGEFGLTNTNRLVRFYRGATGLKTGSTAKAGFCISATAERDGMTLICVIMGAPSRDVRNAAATSLLDWGFANTALYTHEQSELSPMRVCGGEQEFCSLNAERFSVVVDRAKKNAVEIKIELPEMIDAPVAQGDEVGKIVYTLDGEELGSVPITAGESVPRVGFWGIFVRLLGVMSLA
ncbi:MAG: D-alanyl-D-alanine carboxypeptidase [Clostridia bacterium]|nr:D-alanyl-D-alanine carboxypeptidase [Clostridia bacterium]